MIPVFTIARQIKKLKKELHNAVDQVYNRSITFTPTFNSKRDYQRALELLNYYQFAQTA